MTAPFSVVIGLPGVEHPQIVVRDSAQAWVSFLSSPQARTLCKDRLPLSVSRHFALEENRSRFDRFLDRLLAPVATAS